MDSALSIAIDWSRASREGARSAYLEALRNPLPSQYPSHVVPAMELIKMVLHAPFQISKDGVDLLLNDPPGAFDEEVNVLGVLLGLRAGIDLAENGTQELLFWPDWMPLRITCETGDNISVDDHGRVVCAARRDWIAVIDAALEDARNWLNSNLPEVRSDAVLGEWLAGGPLPDVPHVVFPAQNGE